MNKCDSSETELILSVQKGNTISFAKIYHKYSSYSKALANTFFASNNCGGVTRQELYAVCLESLVIAIRNYKGEGHPFYPYWREVASKNMLKYLEKNSYLLGAKAFAGLSIDNISELDNYNMANVLGEIDGEIYGNITYNEMTKDLYKRRIITKFEQDVLNYLLIQFDIESIAIKLKCSKSKVYLAKESIRVKLKNIYGMNKQGK